MYTQAQTETAVNFLNSLKTEFSIIDYINKIS